MILRNLNDIRKSDQNVRSDGWASARMLLEQDGMGFSFHITTLFAGAELKMHYQNHLESVFVLKGKGTIEDLGTGKTHKLKAGDLPGMAACINDEMLEEFTVESTWDGLADALRDKYDGIADRLILYFGEEFYAQDEKSLAKFGEVAAALH